MLNALKTAPQTLRCVIDEEDGSYHIGRSKVAASEGPRSYVESCIDPV